MLDFNRTMAPDPGLWFFGVDVAHMAKVDFDASSSELLGKEIGPYTLVRRLGMGGMAETFVAIRRGPGGFSQRVCLKLVLPFFREDEEFVKLFQREARLAAKLRHSNIVGVIDFGEINGRSYMALELVDGVDLQVLLDAESGKRLSPEYVALIGHDLASALDHAHNPPRESDFDGSYGGAIVHRDISPSNVLVSRHGEIMLTDFGVAKAVSGSSRKQSAVKGKIPYMSPEQLKLEALDGRADLFGVGVVLYEALSGRRPYEGGHDPATIMLILKGERQPLEQLAPGAPPDLCALIDRLIEPDREKRPESAAELVELLDPFVPSPRARRRLGKRVTELRPEEEDTGVSGYPPPRGDDDTARRDDVDGQEREKRTSGIVDAGERQAQVEPWVEGEPPRGTAAAERDAKPSRRRAFLTPLVVLALLVAGGAGWLAMRSAEPDSVELAPVVTQAAANDEAPAAAPTAPDDEPPAVEESAQAVETDAAEDAAPAKPEEVLAEDSPREAAIPAASKPRRTAPAVPVAPATLTVVVYPWGDVWINGKRRGAAPLKNISLKPGRYRIGAGQGNPTVTQTIRLRSGETQKLKLDVTK